MSSHGLVKTLWTAGWPLDLYVLLSCQVLDPLHVLCRMFHEVLFLYCSALGQLLVQWLKFTWTDSATVDALIFMERGEFLALLKCGFLHWGFHFLIKWLFAFLKCLFVHLLVLVGFFKLECWNTHFEYSHSWIRMENYLFCELASFC